MGFFEGWVYCREKQDVRLNAAIECAADHHHDGSGKGSADRRHEGAPAVEEEERRTHHAVPADLEADCGSQGVDGGPHAGVDVFFD